MAKGLRQGGGVFRVKSLSAKLDGERCFHAARKHGMFLPCSITEAYLAAWRQKPTP